MEIKNTAKKMASLLAKLAFDGFTDWVKMLSETFFCWLYAKTTLGYNKWIKTLKSTYI